MNIRNLRRDVKKMKEIYSDYITSEKTLKDIARELSKEYEGSVSANTLGTDFKKMGYKMKPRKGIAKINPLPTDAKKLIEVQTFDDYTIYTMPELFLMGSEDLERLALIEQIRTSQINRLSAGRGVYEEKVKEILREDFDAEFLGTRSATIKNLMLQLKNKDAQIEGLRGELERLKFQKIRVAMEALDKPKEISKAKVLSEFKSLEDIKDASLKIDLD